MTEYEADDHLRVLFQGADLDDVPTTRDLIGPAVAWGDGRRRRDRWTAAGATGAAAAVAVAGIVALRPGGATGPESVAPGRVSTSQSAAKPVTPTSTPPPVELSGTVSQREQELLDALRPYLPTGDRITCQEAGCMTMMIASPTGTSMAEWNSGNQFYMDGPADTKYDHEHKATVAIPLVSGAIEVPGGTLRIQSTDSEAQVNISDKTTLTDPSALVFHGAQYVFTPTGATDPAESVVLSQFELVKEIPWKPGAAEVSDAHALWGFNPTGPVLSPEQFAKLVTAPIYASVLKQLTALESSAGKPSSPH